MDFEIDVEVVWEEVEVEIDLSPESENPSTEG